jgi:hypothetical protein
MTTSTLGIMAKGCHTEAGDLAHQLGTGELVGVAPHWPAPKCQLVVVYTEACRLRGRREIFSTEPSVGPADIL